MAEWGAFGVLAVAFLTFVYGLARNQIVSRDAVEVERKLIELTEKALKLAEDSAVQQKAMWEAAQAREDKLLDVTNRQFTWLESMRLQRGSENQQ